MGLYHIHPGKGAMVGIAHVPTKHSRLIKVGETVNVSTPPPTPVTPTPPSYSPPPSPSPPPPPPSPSPPSYGGGY